MLWCITGRAERRRASGKEVKALEIKGKARQWSFSGQKLVSAHQIRITSNWLILSVTVNTPWLLITKAIAKTNIENYRPRNVIFRQQEKTKQFFLIYLVIQSLIQEHRTFVINLRFLPRQVPRLASYYLAPQPRRPFWMFLMINDGSQKSLETIL